MQTSIVGTGEQRPGVETADLYADPLLHRAGDTRMSRLYQHHTYLTKGRSSTSCVRYLSESAPRILTVSRVKHESVGILEDILSHDECDVDPANSMTGKTPLHYAIESESEYRTSIIDSLLEAGADTR